MPAPSREDLDALLKKIVATKMTPEEIFEQKVSWVYGQLPKGNTRTKDQVREQLRKSQCA